jgi:hypothetical protein
MEPHELDGLAELVRRRLAGRIRDLRLVFRENGIVLQGRACSYYGKQLAQHEVLRVVNAARLVNEIEVAPIPSGGTGRDGVSVVRVEPDAGTSW